MAQKNKKVSEAKEQQVTMEETLNRWEEFFEKNKNGIITALCIVVILIVGIFLYQSKVVKPRETRVAEYLFPAENYFMAGDYKTALEGNGADVPGLLEIADEYSNTKAGKLAAAYAGLSYAQLDSCEIAISYLKKYNGKDQMVAPAVLNALADCYASTDQLAKAAETFLLAAKKADNGLISPYSLFQAGLIYEALGKPAEALKLYKRIKVEYPMSDQAVTIDEYITRVTAK